jgi:hypothetical protein
MRKGWDCDYDKRPLPEPEVKPMRNSVTLKYNKVKCMPIEIVFHLYNGDRENDIVYEMMMMPGLYDQHTVIGFYRLTETSQ